MAQRRSWWHRYLQRRFLRRIGISSLPPWFDESLARAGRYLFVLNDDLTRMEDVVAWLEKTFGFEKEDSVRLMLIIHAHGYGVVGPLPEEEMERWLYTARLRATELGLPHLRFGTQPPGVAHA